MFIISQFPSVRSLGMVQLGPRQGCNQNFRAGFSSRGSTGEGSAPRLTQVVDKFHILVTAWFFTAPGIHGSLPPQSQQQTLSKTILYKIITGVIAQHFCNIFISKLQVLSIFKGRRLYKEVNTRKRAHLNHQGLSTTVTVRIGVFLPQPVNRHFI